MTTVEKQRAYEAAVQTLARVSLAHVAVIHPELEGRDQKNMAKHLLAKAREALRSEEGA